MEPMKGMEEADKVHVLDKQPMSVEYGSITSYLQTGYDYFVNSLKLVYDHKIDYFYAEKDK